MDEKTLGKRLQLARKRAGLTQQELCQKAGLSYSTLAKIERGAIRSPSVFTVSAIAAATGTPLEDLLGTPARNVSSPAPQDSKKRSKTGVTFVYFDIDGVIDRGVTHAFPQIARAAGVSSDIVENVFWRHNDAVCRGQITAQEFNQLIGKELELLDFDWLKYYLEFAEKTPGIADLLGWAAQHYKIGLLSNHMPGLTDELVEKGIVPKLDYLAIVDSCKVGAVKPEPKIYETAQHLANVEPGEILFVDDSRPNLTVADHAGWQIAWFDALDPEQSIKRVKKALEF